MNPAEFLLDLISTDFGRTDMAQEDGVEQIVSAWNNSAERNALLQVLNGTATGPENLIGASQQRRPNPMVILGTLLYRAFLKSYRDVLVYGVRLAMYMGLAIMMGTVWLRLKSQQEYIQPFINAIVGTSFRHVYELRANASQFFGSAFMSFMAVAYVPAYLEDRAVYVKDRANGLYGPTLFLITNFIIGLPYLCMYSNFRMLDKC